MMCAPFDQKNKSRPVRVRKVLIAGSIKRMLKSLEGIRTPGSSMND